MRHKIAFKTLYRSPVRMILTLILLVAVTFTLFSQVLEHAVTVREIEKAEETYDGICAVTATEKYCKTIYNHYLALDPRVEIDEQKEKQLKILNLALGETTEQYPPLTAAQIETISSLPYVTSTEKRYITAGVTEDYERLDDGSKYYNYTHQCLVEGTLVSREILYMLQTGII